MIGNIDILVKELCKLPKEVGWVEFNITIASRQWLVRTLALLQIVLL